MKTKTPFKLKSGNKPAFKDVGSSPIMQEEEKGKKWKQALAKIGNAAVRGLTGGLDAVYGTGKDEGGSSEGEKKEKPPVVVFSENDGNKEETSGQTKVEEQTKKEQ